MGTNKKRYNHMYTIAFEAMSDNREAATDAEIFAALAKRIADISAGGTVQEAVGAPDNTFDELKQRGVNPFDDDEGSD